MKAKHAVYALLGVFCFLVATKLGYCRERAFGYCYQGGHVVITQGLSSDTKVQQSFPSCTVAVYNEGTTTLSNIYADNSGTVKGNPFTSDANGYWFFYANNGRYDVHFYDSDITVPYTQGDYLLCDPADATGAFSCTGGGAGSCPVGALFAQYVDSAQGADGNAGTNWCNSKLTESAGATALPSGGTVREAPNYTGAAATGVPANVNIFRYNQFDSLGSSMQLFAFPDLATSSENHYAFAGNSNSTVAEADTAFSTVGAFGATHLITSVLGNLTVPSTSGFRTREQAGVTGIITNNSALDTYQSDGVLGLCYNAGSLGLDCTGVVGVAGNGASAQSGVMEAMWANLSLHSTTSDAMGLVIRATGGHMPTSQIGSSSGRPNAAIDISYGGASLAADAFPTGIFFENQAAGLTNFAFTGNGTLNQPHTDVFTYDRWWDYYSASTPLDTFSVVKLNNNAIADQATYQAGNYIFQNSTNSSEVVLPINYSGTIKNESIKTVTYSATPTFDRAQGSIQKITLTGDVTSSTLQNCVAGQTIIFDIIEDGVGGHTFSPPANLVDFQTITTTAGNHNRQAFYCDGSSSNSGGYLVPVPASVQTSGTNNSSQSLLNFIASSTDAVGLTITPSNPSGGQEQFEITGGTYLGNSTTATNLSSYPALCAAGEFSQGLSAGSNNCTTPAGGGNVSTSGTPTVGFIPAWVTGTTIGNSSMDDGVTTAGVITSTEPFTITGNALISAVETTAPTGVVSSDLLYPDSTAHRWKMINNNGTAVAVAGASGAITSGNCAQFSGTTGDIVDAGAPCGGSGTGAFGGGLGASYQDVGEIAAPANPAASTLRLYSDSSTHLLSCLTSAGGNCMPGAGTVSDGAGTTTANLIAVSTTSAHVQGYTGTLKASSSTISNTSNLLLDGIAGRVELQPDNGGTADTSYTSASTGSMELIGSNRGFGFEMGQSGTPVSQYQVACLTGAPSTLTPCTAASTTGAIGIVLQTSRTRDGNPLIAVTGRAKCTFDGATTAGNYVQMSASTDGDCTDAGASRPASGEILGRVTTTNVGAGNYSIIVQLQGQ